MRISFRAAAWNKVSARCYEDMDLCLGGVMFLLILEPSGIAGRGMV
jgi:hypothetical protein